MEMKKLLLKDGTKIELDDKGRLAMIRWVDGTKEYFSEGKIFESPPWSTIFLTAISISIIVACILRYF